MEKMMERSFQKLQEAVDLYNKDGKGKAVLQWYDAGQDQAFTDDSCDTDVDELKLSKKKKAKKQRKYNTPMVLALCSPIMKRAHEHVQQSRDIAFVDATSSFDRQNNSIFLLSTVMPAGAVPLGVIVTSDEREETITTGLKYLSSILPNNAFFGKGPQLGPSLVMIDGSSAGRNAITSVWNSMTTLLCTFHFFQRRWTWLHDSNNGVLVKELRIILINKFKDLVYAEKEEQLTHLYSSLQKPPLVQKYPKFLSHLMSLWPHRRQWAHCY